ncbi:metal ABC transporter substrate-binding protein [Lutimonas sp.]|uniref:metal ABC transporter substrate-binding protein n=1 Tax=Lutimonas sp. TaxID=1872403 RepID=UPI003D9B6E11
MKRFTLILIVFLFYGCDKQPAKKKGQEQLKPVVISVNYPLHYFAERIGGEYIEMSYIIPKNVDPAHWEPAETELQAYQKADVVLSYGGNYAQWMTKVSLPSSRIIDISASIEEFLIPLQGGVTHSHGPDGEHHHDGYAMTTWLDFNLNLQQAEAVYLGLLRHLPEKESELTANLNKLKIDLKELHDKMLSAATGLRGKIILGSHPVYQYLSKGYDLNMNSVHFEPNEIPDSHQWEGLTKLVSTSKPNLMLWEFAPRDETQTQLESMGIEIAVFKLCSNKPDDGDFLTVMNENIDLLNSHVSVD